MMFQWPRSRRDRWKQPGSGRHAAESSKGRRGGGRVKEDLCVGCFSRACVRGALSAHLARDARQKSASPMVRCRTDSVEATVRCRTASVEPTVRCRTDSVEAED